MPEDAEYLARYKNNHLYIHPGQKGAYAAVAGESEEIIGEIDVTSRCKLAISAFYVNDRSDFGTFKITKLRFHSRWGWREDEHVHVNHFQLSQMREFLAITSTLDLSDAQKTRISLDNIPVSALGALLSSTKGAEIVNELGQARNCIKISMRSPPSGPHLPNSNRTSSGTVSPNPTGRPSLSAIHGSSDMA